MKTLRNPIAHPDPKPSEWDFTKGRVPDSELAPCYFYEFARESETIRKSVKLYRTLTDPQSPDFNGAVVRGYLACGEGEAYEVFKPLHTFPDKPWQELTRHEKDGVMEIMCWARFRWRAPINFQIESVLNPPLFDDAKEPPSHLEPTDDWWLNVWKEILLSPLPPGPHITGNFEFHLGYPEKELVQRFRAWLRILKQRANLPLMKKGPSSSPKMRDGLKALGAMRLKCDRTPAECQRISKNKFRFCGGNLSSSYGKKINAAWGHFCKLFALPDEERPIHFRKKDRYKH